MDPTRQSAQLGLFDSPLTIWGAQRIEIPDAQLWPQLGDQVGGALQRELHDFVAAARSGIPSRTANLDQAVTGLKLPEAIVPAANSGQPVHC